MSTPIGVTYTELECINTMLHVIGESPINSLDTAGIKEVADAKRVLSEVLIEVQAKGWSWNTDKNFVLPLDLDGRIPLPPNFLRVRSMPQELVSVVKRGDYLYDTGNSTFIFKSPPKLYVVQAINFDDMPHEARLYITIRAARKFQKREVSAELLDRFSEMDEMNALVGLQDADAEAGDYNMLTGSLDLLNILRRF